VPFKKILIANRGELAARAGNDGWRLPPGTNVLGAASSILDLLEGKRRNV